MKKINIKKLNSQIVELSLSSAPKSYIRMQRLENNVFCIISTLVDQDQRGKGIGKKLYNAAIDYVRKENCKFTATCPFVVEMAEKDKTVAELYINTL